MRHRALGKAPVDEGDALMTGVSSVISQSDAPPKRQVEDLLRAYSRLPWLRSVVGKVGYSTASIPWLLYYESTGRSVRSVQRAQYAIRRRMIRTKQMAGELIEIENHPMLDLLESFNPMMTGLIGRKVTQHHIDLVGDAYWLKERDGLGVPVGLWPIPPFWVRSTPTPKRPFYEISHGPWQGTVPAVEMVWFRDPDPYRPYQRGTGIAAALGDELETDEFACHSQDTECLTKRGWVDGLKLLETDEVATWNEGAQLLEFQKPSDIHIYDHNGPMHQWAGKATDALVTPNHRMFLRRPYDKVWSFEASEECLDHQKLTGQLYIRISGPKKSADPAKLTIKPIPYPKGARGSRANGFDEELNFSAKEFAPFLGWFISEGWIHHASAMMGQLAGDGREYFIESIESALSIFPAEWRRRSTRNFNGKPALEYAVRHKGLTEWLKKHVGDGARNKRIPECLFDWDRDAQEAFINAFVLGDGHRVSATHFQIRSTSEGLVDDLQRLCVLLGWRSKKNHGEFWDLTVTTQRADRCLQHQYEPIRQLEYVGKVWCVTVPNQTVFTRRNGCVLLSGNSKHMKTELYNRGVPEILITAENLGQEETRRLETDWKQKNRGLFKQLQVYFINRKVDVKQLGQSFRNLQLIQLREFERDIVIQVFGVPPEILGIIEHSNRATVTAADYLFSRWVLVPRLELQRSVMQEYLVTDFDERLILDYESPVEEDAERQLKAAQLAPWALTVDEWRVLQGQEALPGGAGQVHMVPQNLVPMRSLAGVPPAQVQPGLPQASAGDTPAKGPRLVYDKDAIEDIEDQLNRLA